MIKFQKNNVAAKKSSEKGIEMNINKQLLEAANLNPTKNSRQEYIFTLCELIEKNELTLPLYQRDVVGRWLNVLSC